MSEEKNNPSQFYLVTPVLQRTLQKSAKKPYHDLDSVALNPSSPPVFFLIEPMLRHDFTCLCI
jgi:hypothetical protein